MWVTRVESTGGPVPLPSQSAGVMPWASVGAASGRQQPGVTANAFHHVEEELNF